MKHSFKKKIVACLIGLTGGVLLFAGAACSDKGDASASTADVTLEGVKDVHISATATAYDFEKGVTALDGLDDVEFSVDATAVQFGKAGKYEVIYTVGDYKESCFVYVYGTPAFTQVKTELSYQDLLTNSGLTKAVTAKDSFDEGLSVQVVQGASVGELGYVEYGSSHTVKFTATDKVGNVGDFACSVTLSTEGRPQFEPIAIDLADVQKSVELGVKGNLKLIENGVALDGSSYTYINGYLTFAEDYIMAKTKGNYTLTAITDKGYNDVTLQITDNRPANFRFEGEDVEYAEKIYIAKAELIGNQQNITFEYAVTDTDGNALPVVEEGDLMYFVPAAKSQFTVTATAKREGENVGSKSYPLNVHDDVYAWTVNAKDNYEDIYLNGGTLGEYSTEKAPTGYSGSYHLTAQQSGVGAFQILLDNTASVTRGSSFSFYVYNPNGVKLTAYLFTNSGYWTNTVPLGGVLTNQAEIPATEGWHKVTITLRELYDGTLGGMTAGADEPDGAKTELRIITEDWTYAGENPYQVYISNIYLERTHDETEIEYVNNGYADLGAIHYEFNLPYARSTDARFTFEYALTLNGQPVATENNAFTPTEMGTYTYTIASKWREREIATETYTFTIAEAALGLATEAYYAYDGNGIITLPAANVAMDTTGKTVEYSVTNPAGTTTVLGADRAYNTGKVHGEYTYKVAIKNGNAEERSATATFKVQSANVFFGCGNSGEGVTYDNLNVNNVTIVSYTTEEAAPGEIGSMKLSQGAWSYNTAGQPRLDLALQLSGYVKAGATKLTFWIKHEDPTNTIMVNSYSTNGGWGLAQRINGRAGVWDANLSTNATTYNEWAPHIAGGGWYQVEIDITNNPGAEFRLLINSDQQTFNCDLPVYISNIYYM